MDILDRSPFISCVSRWHQSLPLKKVWGYLLLGMGACSLPMMIGSSAYAQSTDSTVHFIPLPIANYDVDDLADRGAPDGRQAAGTRGPCLATSDLVPDSALERSALPPELTALMPTIPIAYGEEHIQTPMGTTANAHPHFLFYMPYTQTVVKGIQLTLQDADDYLVASVEVPVPSQTGLLSVQWPQDQSPLKAAENYRWLLQVDCYNPAQPSEGFTTDLVVEGFIQRLVLPTPEPTAPFPSDLEIASQWAASGIWNDSLHLLASQPVPQPQPDTISMALEQLLSSVGLEQFSPYFASR